MVPYGDLRETEMAKVMQQHDKWRAIDQQNAAGADGGASGNARAPVSYRNVRYVQGYVSALMFRIAAERVLANGQKITGDTLKAALETFRNVETGGLTDKLTFTPTDHRGQSTESIYKISSTGSLVYEPPDRRIFLENSWLGW
jgi:branched-chain amino acid transport system substrate-binding protein